MLRMALAAIILSAVASFASAQEVAFTEEEAAAAMQGCWQEQDLEIGSHEMCLKGGPAGDYFSDWCNGIECGYSTSSYAFENAKFVIHERYEYGGAGA